MAFVVIPCTLIGFHKKNKKQNLMLIICRAVVKPEKTNKQKKLSHSMGKEMGLLHEVKGQICNAWGLGPKNKIKLKKKNKHLCPHLQLLLVFIQLSLHVIFSQSSHDSGQCPIKLTNGKTSASVAKHLPVSTAIFLRRVWKKARKA